MRAPSRDLSSFKDIITKFLQKLDLDESQVELLCRLRDDPNCCLEGIWKRFIEKEPEATTADRAWLVGYILEVWGIIETVRIDVVIDRSQRIITKANARLKKWLAKQVLSAPSHQKVAALIQEYATVFETHEPNFIWDFFPELDIRSDHGSLHRTAFMRFMSNMMHRLTGLWCDEEVRALTEAAFPDMMITIDMVQSARRPMQSKPKTT
jgi:hypothetical protein